MDRLDLKSAFPGHAIRRVETRRLRRRAAAQLPGSLPAAHIELRYRVMTAGG